MKNAGTIIGIVLLVVLVLLLVGGAGMMGFGGMGGMMGGYGGYGGMMTGYGFNPIGMILSLVLWALLISGIVLLVVWLVRNANRDTSFIGSGESALDILKKRYAKGEVTKEEFDRMKRDLEG